MWVKPRRQLCLSLISNRQLLSLQRHKMARLQEGSPVVPTLVLQQTMASLLRSAARTCCKRILTSRNI